MGADAASGVAVLAGAIFLGKRIDPSDAKPANVPFVLLGAAIGCVIGLVAITPCAGWVSVGQSFFIAFIVTLCCNVAVTWKNKKHTFDDALDVFPTHGLGGIIGSILTGVFAYDFFNDAAIAEDEEMISHTEFFWMHVLAIVNVCVYTFVVSYALYWLTNKMIPMRVSKKSERIGLDIS